MKQTEVSGQRDLPPQLLIEMIQYKRLDHTAQSLAKSGAPLQLSVKRVAPVGPLASEVPGTRADPSLSGDTVSTFSVDELYPKCPTEGALPREH